MAEETLLTDEFLRQLMTVGEVDILIGVPTHNNAKTIQPVIRSIQTGILKCFPRERAVIINADGGSQDGTPQMVTGASIDDMWSASKVYALRTLQAQPRSSPIGCNIWSAQFTTTTSTSSPPSTAGRNPRAFSCEMYSIP